MALIDEQPTETLLRGATDGALERARVGWQNHGYFKVQVNGYAQHWTAPPPVGALHLAFTWTRVCNTDWAGSSLGQPRG